MATVFKMILYLIFLCQITVGQNVEADSLNSKQAVGYRPDFRAYSFYPQNTNSMFQIAGSSTEANPGKLFLGVFQIVQALEGNVGLTFTVPTYFQHLKEDDYRNREATSLLGVGDISLGLWTQKYGENATYVLELGYTHTTLRGKVPPGTAAFGSGYSSVYVTVHGDMPLGEGFLMSYMAQMEKFFDPTLDFFPKRNYQMSLGIHPKLLISDDLAIGMQFMRIFEGNSNSENTSVYGPEIILGSTTGNFAFNISYLTISNTSANAQDYQAILRFMFWL